jgi:hypothetical protein
MAVNLSPVGGVAAQFFDNNGNPLTGGKIYTYAAGTTTPQVTYTSSSGATAHTNPIVLDAAGRVPSGEIWLTVSVTYKFVLRNSVDVLIGTYDNISSAFNTDSSLVTYTPAGTGAVATTVQAKLRQNVSVMDFGAVGDGVADDTAEIQAAINSIGGSGGVVYFPTGRYKISSSLVIGPAYNGVTLAGANGTSLWVPNVIINGGSLIVKSAAMTSEAIRLNGSNGFSMENLAITGESGNTGDGIYLPSGLSPTLRNVSVSKMGGVGIRIGAKSGSSGNNVNCWQMLNVASQNNASHGVLINDETLVGGPNANAGTATGLNVAGNGGDGLRIEVGQFNTFNGLLSQQNTGYGVSLIGTVPLSLYTTFNGGDVEANTAGEWYVDPNAKHLIFSGAFPNVPSFDPVINFASLISGISNRFRSVDIKNGTAILSSLNLGQASNLTYYNTGQFGPIIAGTTTAGTNTYAFQEGYYTRVGNLVFVQGYVQLTAKGTGANSMGGALYIGNLPFAQLNSSRARAPMQIQATGGLTFGAGYSSQTQGRTFENLNQINLYKIDSSTGALVEIFASEISDTTAFYFSGSYVAVAV